MIFFKLFDVYGFERHRFFFQQTKRDTISALQLRIHDSLHKSYVKQQKTLFHLMASS